MPGGHAYAREIRGALGNISNASLNLLANPSGGTLTLAVPPTFGAHWPVPRLVRAWGKVTEGNPMDSGGWPSAPTPSSTPARCWSRCRPGPARCRKKPSRRSSTS